MQTPPAGAELRSSKFPYSNLFIYFLILFLVFVCESEQSKMCISSSSASRARFATTSFTRFSPSFSFSPALSKTTGSAYASSQSCVSFVNQKYRSLSFSSVLRRAAPRWSYGVEWRSPVSLRAQARISGPVLEQFERKIATLGAWVCQVLFWLKKILFWWWAFLFLVWLVRKVWKFSWLNLVKVGFWWLFGMHSGWWEDGGRERVLLIYIFLVCAWMNLVFHAMECYVFCCEKMAGIGKSSSWLWWNMEYLFVFMVIGLLFHFLMGDDWKCSCCWVVFLSMIISFFLWKDVSFCSMLLLMSKSLKWNRIGDL